MRTFLEHKDYTTAIDINPHYITPKMLQFRLQKIMDEYVAGCATYYNTNDKMLAVAEEKLEMLKEDAAKMRAKDLHELLRAWENYHRIITAEAHMKHIQFREESRYPGFYYRTDKNFVDEKNWHCFVNSVYDKRRRSGRASSASMSISSTSRSCSRRPRRTEARLSRCHVRAPRRGAPGAIGGRPPMTSPDPHPTPLPESPVLPEMLDGSKTIRFRCHRGVACWNACCSNIDISLTPYDILRLKRRLGLTSTEFLERYTVPYEMEKDGIAGVKLRPVEGGTACRFMRPEGCGVYEDRPTACRYYPVALAVDAPAGRIHRP